MESTTKPIKGNQVNNNFLTQQELADMHAEIAKDGYRYTFEQWLER